MSSYYTIHPPLTTPDCMIADRDTFIRSAQAQWPDCRVFQREDHEGRFADAYVYPVLGGYETEVSHFPDNQTIAYRGAPDMQGTVEIAAWVRTLNPDPETALWLIEGDFSGHAILTPGITPNQIIRAWVNDSGRDPVKEYPEFFGEWSAR